MNTPVEFLNVFDGVRTFNTTGGQTVRDTADLFIPLGERKLRFDLIAEEVDELIEKGFKSLDIVEVADGLADIVYVAVGAGLTHGFEFDIERPDSEFRLNLSQDRLMRDAYAEKMRSLVLGLFEFSSPSQNAQYQCSNCGNDNCRLDTVKVLLQDIVYYCYLIAASYGIDLDLVLEEVQASNMSKFSKPDKPGQPLKVYRNEKGKVTKGPDYFKADIPSVLRKQGLSIATVGGWNPEAAELEKWPHFNGKPLPYLSTINLGDDHTFHVFIGSPEDESWKVEGGANCVRVGDNPFPEWIETAAVDAPVLASDEEMVSVPVTFEADWVQADETPENMDLVTQIPSQINGKTLVNIGDAYGTAYVFKTLATGEDEPVQARVLWQS